MGVIDTVLGQAGAAYADLAKLAVTVGPGSFTGVRVGVAAVRGLALALAIPAVGISTLEALAEPHRKSGRVLAAIDAKRGELYAALYAPDGALMAGPTALEPQSLGAFLQTGGAKATDEPLRIVGSGAVIAEDALGAFCVQVADTNSHDIAAVARLAASRDPAEAPASPLYLRGADAKPQAPSGLLAPRSFPESA